MKKPIIILMGMLGLILASMVPCRAQMVSKEDAFTIAKNWINLIVHLKGNWGGVDSAEISDVQELKHNQRILGYVCYVNPQGYIVIPLRKEMVPIKMYSASSNLDMESEDGKVSLIKGSMERQLNRIEQRLGPVDLIPASKLKRIMEVDHQPLWDKLNKDTALFSAQLESGIVSPMNYQQSQLLLTSSWSQEDPYNRQCPAPPSGDDCTATRCLVGCGPLADSQIMRYWAWPPYGEGSPYNDTYDWVNMPDTLTVASPTLQINAVAELCREVGQAGNAGYCLWDGCQTGNVMFDNMDAFMDHHRYSQSLTREERRLYASTDAWFTAIKTQIDLNRPVIYEIPSHFVVVDGWQEIGNPPVQEVHVVYGWGGGNDSWYTLDYDIPGTDSNWQWEKMVPNIVPEPIIGATLAGSYGRDILFPYRYFDRDCTGFSANFAAGQNLQFLPGITARGTSTAGGYIRFTGSNEFSTRLYSIRGTLGTAIVAGAQFYGGALRLYQNGGIRFH